MLFVFYCSRIAVGPKAARSMPSRRGVSMLFRNCGAAKTILLAHLFVLCSGCMAFDRASADELWCGCCRSQRGPAQRLSQLPVTGCKQMCEQTRRPQTLYLASKRSAYPVSVEQPKLAILQRSVIVMLLGGLMFRTGLHSQLGARPENRIRL